jgi:hypothetical protein
MKIADNHEAKIWLGLRERYTDTYFDKETVSNVIGKWCTVVGQCVSVSDTEFFYVKNDETGTGREKGLVIGFINYPRYPLSSKEIQNRAVELADLLMREFSQYRVSVTLYPPIPNGVIMLENEHPNIYK